MQSQGVLGGGGFLGGLNGAIPVKIAKMKPGMLVEYEPYTLL